MIGPFNTGLTWSSRLTTSKANAAANLIQGTAGQVPQDSIVLLQTNILDHTRVKEFDGPNYLWTRHTIRELNNFTELPTTQAHWPQRLREFGYQTAYLGKWHMGEENDAPRPGFDFFATHKGQGKYFETEWNINGAGSKLIPGYYTHIVTDLALDWLKRGALKKRRTTTTSMRAPVPRATSRPIGMARK